MPIVIQNILISLFLRPISKLTNKFSEKIKNIIFIVGFNCLVLMQFADSSAAINVRFLVLFVMACIFFFLMILSGLNTDIKAVKFNIPLSICWYSMALFMLLSSIFVSFDYIAHFIVWAIVFPVIFIVWGNNDHLRLIKLIITSIEISFVLFLIISFFLFDFRTNEYKAFFMNQNSNAAYAVPVLLCSIVHILSEKNSIKKILFPCFIAGASFANLLYSSSRASMLSAFGALLVTVVVYVILKFKELKNIILFKFVPIALSLVVLFTILPTIFNLGYSSMPFMHNTKLHQTIKLNRAEIEGVELSKEELESDEYDPFLNNQQENSSQDNKKPATNDGVINNIVDNFDMSGGVTEFSNGRIGLWKLYAKELSFLGNPTDKVLINVFGEEEDRESHLTPLQFSYEFGFLTGIFFLIFNAISGILTLMYAIKNKDKEYSLFPLTIALGYVALSLFEVMMSPITRIIVTVYLLSQAIIMVKSIKKEKV